MVRFLVLELMVVMPLVVAAASAAGAARRPRETLSSMLAHCHWHRSMGACTRRRRHRAPLGSILVPIFLFSVHGVGRPMLDARNLP